MYIKKSFYSMSKRNSFKKSLSKNSISVKNLFLIFFTSSLWSRINPFKSNLLYLLQSWGVT